MVSAWSRLSTWWKEYRRKKKRERMANALSEMNEVLKYCREEENRFKKAAARDDRDARHSRKDPIVASRFLLRKKLHEEQADLSQRYIQLLSDEMIDVSNYNTSRQVARAMKIGANATTSKKTLTCSGI